MGKVHLLSLLVAASLVGLVLGLSSYNEQAEAGISIGPSCDTGGVLVHFDKIVFQTDRILFNLFQPALVPTLHYDIKVQQDPFFVTNLEQTVADFLNAKSFKRGNGGSVLPGNIIIVDVEYDTPCTSIGPPVVDVDMDGFSPPADCDDGDPLVNPIATEICNSIDDNCNELIDEGGVCFGVDGGAMSNFLPLSINSLGFEY